MLCVCHSVHAASPRRLCETAAALRGAVAPRRRRRPGVIFWRLLFDTRRPRPSWTGEAARGVLWVREQCCKIGCVGGCSDAVITECKDNRLRWRCLAPWRALSNRVLNTHRSLVSGRPERYAKHRCANESGVARRESGKAAPRRWVALLCLWGRTIGPRGSRSLLGGLLAGPQFAAEQEPQPPGCPSRWEVPSSVLHHGAPSRRTTGRRSSDTNSARKVPRPQHHA